MMDEGLNSLLDKTYRIEDGKIVISNNYLDESAAIIVTDDGVSINSKNVSTGITINNDGVIIQGDTAFTGYGTSIKKSHYSENPLGAKIFTYTETIEIEAMIKEKLSEIAGKAGVNTGDLLSSAGLGNLDNLTKGGMIPLITDVSYGPIPHIHTMLFKHVHRMEPTYLYRIPGYLKIFKDFISKFVGFLS